VDGDEDAVDGDGAAAALDVGAVDGMDAVAPLVAHSRRCSEDSEAAGNGKAE
jgi:hypothetical protein